MITAYIKFTPDFLIEAMRRSRKLRRTRYIGIAVKSISLAFLVPLVLWITWRSRIVWLGNPVLQGQIVIGLVIFAALSVFMLNAHHVDYWLARRRFRKSPYYDEEIFFEFSEIGVHTRSTKQDGTLHWSAFTKVAHLKDGFLLFQGPNAVNWIPLSSLDNPSEAGELAALLRAKIPQHTIVAQNAPEIPPSAPLNPDS